MNETGHNPLPGMAGKTIVRMGAVAAVLVTASLWLLGGCADPRTKPSAPVNPGHTETVVLWQNTPAGPDGMVSATFNVDDELAPINRPGLDTPARLAVAVFIEPDCQILRREQIVADSVGYISDSLIIPRLAAIIPLKDSLTAADRDTVTAIEVRTRAFIQGIPMAVDSSQLQNTFGGITCDTAVVGFHQDPAIAPISAADLAILQAIPVWGAQLATLESEWAQAVLDTARLGAERDYLGRILENRYTLAIALDNPDVKRYPDAVYSTELAGALTGQGIHLAQTDSATGLKGRGFTIPLSQFAAADPVNQGEALEVNWVTCFAGSEQPCLAPGQHTLYAWITGRNPRITGTLVLVYAEER